MRFQPMQQPQQSQQFQQQTQTANNYTSLTKTDDFQLQNYEDPNLEIQQKVEETRLALRNAPEVIRLSKEVDVMNANSILEFGNRPALEVSKFSDSVLKTINNNTLQDTGVLLQKLPKILKQFDRKELERIDNTNKGIISRFFNNAAKALENLLKKYENLGRDIEAVNTEIIKYKDELMRLNTMLDDMYDHNIRYYEEIEKYIVAGEMVIEELRTEDLPYFEDKAKSGNQVDVSNLNMLRETIELFETRIADLEMAKMVAIQTAPQIRLLQRGNNKLIAKIHSAFIVTIPAFKNGILQAVAAKRAKIAADSMEALDNYTNEILMKSAENTTEVSKQIARISGSPSIRIETLEKNMEVILRGLEETRQIEMENKAIRDNSVQRVHQLQHNLQQKLLKG